MLDRSISSTITVGGATNAGTFEAAELMVAGMSAREVAWLRLVVDEAALTSSDIGAATSEVKKGIATDLKWARGEIKKNNVWWS